MSDPGKLIRFLVVFPLITWASLAQAQDASFSGIVVDKEGLVVANANIILNQNEYHAVTNVQGYFSFGPIEPGTYNIRVSSVGYRAYAGQIDIPHHSKRELTITLKSRIYLQPAMVVTATRTPRNIEKVPEPVTVISKREISASGSTRLSNILAEQTGLNLISDHGTGVQVQGFDANYTKIMIDGQPVIGRTAGTLDLDRISIGNVKQIEMVKGPSSALWGSDALAGVINIITEEGRQPFELGFSSRYGGHGTLDLGLNLSVNSANWENHIFLNRNSSRGYRLVPNSIGQTVSPYHNYTASYRTSVSIMDDIELKFRGRYYREDQNNTDYVGDTGSPTLLDGNALQEDYSLAPTLKFNLGDDTDLKLTHFSSRYRTDTQYHYRQDGGLYSDSKFDQYYSKTELQLRRYWTDQQTTTAGTGYMYERLRADRSPGRPVLNSYFLYAQHEWQPLSKWDLIGGLRFDGHSEYTSQLSPKLSTRYQLLDWLALRGSAGGGFKAADFRELFLDFTNSTVGYTVFGSNTVAQRIQELQAQGQIAQILTPPGQLKQIEAERSWAYNVGLDLLPAENVSLRLNLFYNDVDNMIETAPVATKTNGQSVFSYFNLKKVYTQGLEAQLRWRPIPQIRLSGGYQLLEARRKVEQTKMVQDPDGNIVKKEVSSYRPLFNRSKHSANIKLYYRWDALGLGANVRGNWYGKYGYADANGNGYVDKSEYQDDYSIWNIAVSKTFKDRYTLRLGVDNVFDFIRPSSLPYLSGRLFYAQASIKLY